MSETYQTLFTKALTQITELMPWDLVDELAQEKPLLLVDVREQNEFNVMHIKHAIHVPRGVLESACEWGYHDTVPALANGRKQSIVLICRSGRRSALATLTMKQLGFKHVRSLALGIKGWNDSEFKLINAKNKILNTDEADAYLNQTLTQNKLTPSKKSTN